MDKRETIFSFRVSPEERTAIVRLAATLRRSQSDAVRVVVTEAARVLRDVDAQPTSEGKTPCQR